ncbi:MAG: DUF1971 domain-containing protein [Thermosynechococcaceae cyanobacterium]
MKTLPSKVIAYRQTPVFTQETIPDALLHRHTTKEGSWGKLCVISGQLRYRILTDPPEEHMIKPGSPGIIEPQTPHQVEPMGPVELFVEFFH